MQHHDARRDLAHEVEIVLDQDRARSRSRRSGGGGCRRSWCRSALVRPAVGSSSRTSCGSSASTMASSRACFNPWRQKPRLLVASRSPSPVSREDARGGGGQRRAVDGLPKGWAVAPGAGEPKAVGDAQASRRRWPPGICGRGRAPRSGAAQAARSSARRSSPIRRKRSRPSARQRISVVLPAPFGPDQADEFAADAPKTSMPESTERLPKCLEHRRPRRRLRRRRRPDAAIERGQAATLAGAKGVLREQRSRVQRAGAEQARQEAGR